jgi:methylmalonyl-CoA/ethylmalonyl-CoA epimerase
MAHYGLEFHHLGLAVAHPDKAARFVAGLGYTLGPPIYDPLQKVNLIMCLSPGGPAIEIISSSGEAGPLDGILKNRTELLYHLGFTARDLEASLQAIKEDGNQILCVSPPKEAVLFAFKQVSFYYVSGFGLIEIIQDLP